MPLRQKLEVHGDRDGSKEGDRYCRRTVGEAEQQATGDAPECRQVGREARE